MLRAIIYEFVSRVVSVENKLMEIESRNLFSAIKNVLHIKVTLVLFCWLLLSLNDFLFCLCFSISEVFRDDVKLFSS